MHENIFRLLSPNRAEELGYDVWERYVVPPTFANLTIGDTRKPRVIIGGRGCGKTMLLRYLSHESAFSISRPSVPSDALSHIGLYWRSDTQFSSLMQHRGIPDDVWEGAFRHLAAVVLGIEVLSSLESIARSKCDALHSEDIGRLDLGRMKAYDSALPSTAHSMREHLEDRLAQFESWANNVRTMPVPHFLPGHDFLKRLIHLVREQSPKLASAGFFVYIDEYENLAEYQQRIINTWLKHSEPPLVFNLAMKRNGFKTRSTDGSESLAAVHDYRPFDLEAFDLETEFPRFAAEILLLRLKLGGVKVSAIDPEQLRDVEKLSTREKPDYARTVLNAMRALFPSVTQTEMAANALSDSVLRRRLQERIAAALEEKGVATSRSEEFIVESSPEASVVVPALLRRPAITVQIVKQELERLVSGADNRFTGTTDWIHNNFIGCYLQLFEGLGRPCPLYGGFSTYCYMSRGNLRHFLELCLRALSRSEGADSLLGESVPVDVQADAARQVSADLLPEVRSFGPEGNNLHAFLLRLGSLFSLSQHSPTQSEPERTHFGIVGGDTEIDEQVSSFLSEAVKWSVLFEEKGTKKKDTSDADTIEYVLNPIYSPYFHISYRKRRKLELTPNEVSTLIKGQYKTVKGMLRDFQRKWSVDLAEGAFPLFSHLTEDHDE
jgi:hypothetical protein